MNSFYEDFGKIVIIALFGVLLIGLFSAFIGVETEEVIMEYNDMQLRANGSYIITPILNGTLNVTYMDAEKIAIQINDNPTKLYEGEYISITIPTEPEKTYRVCACAVDKNGKQTDWKCFNLMTKC